MASAGVGIRRNQGVRIVTHVSPFGVPCRSIVKGVVVVECSMRYCIPPLSMNNTLGLVVVPKVTGMGTLAPISGRVNNAANDGEQCSINSPGSIFPENPSAMCSILLTSIKWLRADPFLFRVREYIPAPSSDFCSLILRPLSVSQMDFSI